MAAMAAALLLAPAGTAAAGKKPSLQVAGELSAEEGFTDNVRASADNEQGAFFTTVAVAVDLERRKQTWGLPRRFGGSLRGRHYSEFDERDFFELSPYLGYDLGRFDLLIDYRYSPDRLRVERDDDDSGFADEHEIAGELRTKWGRDRRWTAALEVGSEWQDYGGTDDERDSVEPDAKLWLRMRAHDLFTPRAGIAYARRDSDSEDQDRETVEVFTAVESRLHRNAVLAFRYERSWRNYTTGSPESHGETNDNFGRDDDIDEIETSLRLGVPWLRGAAVVLRYRHRRLESTREGRDYTVNEGGLGLEYAFD